MQKVFQLLAVAMFCVAILCALDAWLIGSFISPYPASGTESVFQAGVAAMFALMAALLSLMISLKLKSVHSSSS